MSKNGKRRRERMKINNLVAKHARKVCKASVHRDRKNDYRRKEKHSKRSED